MKENTPMSLIEKQIKAFISVNVQYVIAIVTLINKKKKNGNKRIENYPT